MLSSPVGEFISELQTSEIPEGLMKHGVFMTERAGGKLSSLVPEYGGVMFVRNVEFPLNYTAL
jgi:hypothetical protein